MRASNWLVLVLLTLVGGNAVAAACDGFVDVDSGNTTYCTAVSYVKDRGVTVGCTDDTHYCPNDYVTRLQMALFLQRMGRADPSNTLGDHTTAIGGGVFNTATAPDPGGAATVGGGSGNTATGNYATVGGGIVNTAANFHDTVAGGWSNVASGISSTVAGGQFNTASGLYSAILGGRNNTASGVNSIAVGYEARADQEECLVVSLWSADQPGASCGGFSNTVVIGADHGISFAYGSENTSNGDGTQYVYIGDLNSGNTIAVWNGASLTNGGTWSNASDRALKTDFVSVDGVAILDQVAAMPMDSWRYKSESGQRHIGPMAQDFYAAFGLGADDKHITTVDEGGIALAAIQGLNAKLETRDAVIAALAVQVQLLTKQMAALRAEK